MPSRSATRLIPSTLTFLIEEHRVCEAEAIVRSLASGNGHAVWTPDLAGEWRSHLRENLVDLGEFPVFPLLYLRNNQLPRAIRSFETEVVADASLGLTTQVATFLEMLRLFWMKRRVPLAALTTKLKRDRVHLITTERFEVGKKQLFDAGFAMLAGLQHPQEAYRLAVGSEWVVYPLIREFLGEVQSRLSDSGRLPAWWLEIELQLAKYSEDLPHLRDLNERLAGCGLPTDEIETLQRRFTKQIKRLETLEAREAERAAKETAYLDSIREDWLVRLTELPILERQPRAWEEYQDFRDRYTPRVVGTATDLLPKLPREATYTVWQVGAILPFLPQKTIRLRPAQGKVRKVNPDDVLSFGCACLEHYTVEEDLRQPQVTHHVVLRLKEDVWALFDLSPKQPGEAESPAT